MTQEQVLELFRQHRDMVYRLALAVCHNAPDAEDITQSVFLKLLDSGEGPLPGKEKAWLHSVTLNACRDMLRSTKRHATVPLEDNIAISAPEELRLWDAVMALPPKYRAAVHLHYYEGYSFQEIGSMLGLSASAISMRLHRARNILRSKLKEDDYEELVSENI